MGKRTKTGRRRREWYDADRVDSAIGYLYAIARSTPLIAVRSERFFRGKVPYALLHINS